MRKELPRVIVKGGVLSPLELKNIALTAEKIGLKAISFGSRQDILFPTDASKIEAVGDLQIVSDETERIENIISSYVSIDIFPSTGWLTSDKYLYILERFRHQPKLKINITDPKQQLVPLFTGHLNFIASDHEDYWYLYIRLSNWENNLMYPVLIYTWDIAKIAKEIENILQEEPENTETVFQLITEVVDSNNRTIDKPLDVPFYPFPYYEGMNRLGSDEYWLGLYWRNNRYDTTFLKAMCDLCTECRIGKISITPWKSFIVKGIPTETILEWERFLGKFGINVRHSSLELNWHLPVDNQEALALKEFLVANFDKNDISTYGLTFGIIDYIQKGYYFTAIVIQKNLPITTIEDFKIRDTYNLLYAKNFDPNTREYIVYAQDVDKEALPFLLMEMSKMYFEQLGSAKYTKKKTVEAATLELQVHQCRDCQTIYDANYGDITQGIQPSTLFEELPNSYVCPTCEAPKENFEKKTLIKQVK